MNWLQNVLQNALQYWLGCFLVFALIIGVFFMVVSTVFVIKCLITGNVNIHIVRNDINNEEEINEE